MTIPDSLLFTYKSIVAFVNDMNEIYGPQYKPLRLYALLLGKTGIVDEAPIQKHVQAFKTFVVANEEAIVEKRKDALGDGKIEYSENVYIELRQVFELAKNDAANTECLWKHLLTLLMIFNPSRHVEELLSKHNNGAGSQEDDFLSKLIRQVGDHVDPSANPMQTVQTLMTSGVFQDVMSSMDKGIQDGSLDMVQMIGSLQKMVGSLSSFADMAKPPTGGSPDPARLT